MNLKKKIYTGLATSLLLAPVALGSIASFEVVNVSSEQLAAKADITVHKVQVSDTEFPTKINNETPGVLAAKPPIKDVKFALYDFTAEYVAARQQTGATAQSAYDVIVAQNSAIPLPTSKTPIAYATTGDQGTATFSQVDQGQNGTNKCYIIVEIDASKAKINKGTVANPDWQLTTVTHAENVVITLPIIKDGNNAAGTTNNVLEFNEADNTLDVYPKNVSENITKTLITDSTSNHSDVLANDGLTTVNAEDRAIGEYADFKIDTPIPADFAATVTGLQSGATTTVYKHDSWELVDTPDKEFSFNGLTSVTIKDSPTAATGVAASIANNKISWTVGTVNYELPCVQTLTHPTVSSGTQDKVTWKITPGALDADTTKALQALAGKTITWMVRMVVDEDATPELAFNNEATSKDYNNEVDSSTNVISLQPAATDTVESAFTVTYGRKFVKLDGDTQLPLGEAKFVVVSNDGLKYYVGDNSTNGDVWKPISSVTGTSETALTTAGVQVYTATASGTDKGKFEVKGLRIGDYKVKEISTPTGYILLTDPVAFDVTTTTWSSPDDQTNDILKTNGGKDILNYHKGFLPSTGGHGIIALVLGGLVAFLAGAGILVWRKQRETENNIA